MTRSTFTTQDWEALPGPEDKWKSDKMSPLEDWRGQAGMRLNPILIPADDKNEATGLPVGKTAAIPYAGSLVLNPSNPRNGGGSGTMRAKIYTVVPL